VSSSGAPRKVVGMVSWNVWEIETLMMNTAINARVKVDVIPALSNGCKSAMITGEIERRMSAMLFTCKPGRRPVNTPVNTPRIQKLIRSVNWIII